MPNYKAVNADQLDADLTTVANAIRTKSGTSAQLSFPDGMTAKIASIIPKESVTWHQCPQVVRDYLAHIEQNPYTPNNYTVSYIQDYASLMSEINSGAAESVCRPIGITIDGVTFYDNEPNVATPFITTNKMGTLTFLDKVRFYNTTPQAKLPNEIFQRGYNCRDLGGWDCYNDDGQKCGTVRYGTIIRGGEPNPVDKELMVNKIGIKTEVQLLPVSEQRTYVMCSPWGIDWAGNTTQNSSVYALENPSLMVHFLHEIFDSVIHDKPVYFHCGIGADRTGNIARIIEAILGMSQCDIDIDYELTSFSYGYQNLEAGVFRSRAYPTYVNDIESIWNTELIGNLPNTFRNHVISYVVKNGLSIDEINAFRQKVILPLPNVTPEIISLNIDPISVTRTGNNISFSDSEAESLTVPAYSSYEVEITPNYGYAINSFKVSMDGLDITEECAKGDFVNAYCPVNTDLTLCAKTTGKNKVVNGESYVAEITAFDNAVFQSMSNIHITMDGEDITEQVAELLE